MTTTFVKNPKITLIGAGGFVFPFRLIGDILSFPALRDATLTLMDIDPDKLGPVAEATRELVAHHGFAATVEETTDRRAALDGADSVIITFQVGGVDRKSTRLNSSHVAISYAVFCLKKKRTT